jgi:CRISPR type III-B/RAMP module-associated protein Cmr5
MAQKIDRLIPSALEAVETCLVDKNTQTVAKEYKGYVSALGAGILQNGLLTTLALFSDKGDSKQDRKKLLEAIWMMVNNTEAAKRGEQDDNRLFNHALGLEEQALPQFQEEVLEAAVALKLALRTFKTTT